MSKRAELSPQVTGECADVSPLADERFAVRIVAVRYPNEAQFSDLHRSLGRSRWPVPSCKPVSPISIDSDRRIGGRALLDRAEKAREHRLDCSAAGAFATFTYDLAFAVVRRAGDTPADAEPISFAPGHGIGRGFRCLAYRDRQHTGRERVECAGMSDFACGA